MLSIFYIPDTMLGTDDYSMTKFYKIINDGYKNISLLFIVARRKRISQSL